MSLHYYLSILEGAHNFALGHHFLDMRVALFVVVFENSSDVIGSDLTHIIDTVGKNNSVLHGVDSTLTSTGIDL